MAQVWFCPTSTCVKKRGSAPGSTGISGFLFANCQMPQRNSPTWLVTQVRVLSAKAAPSKSASVDKLVAEALFKATKPGVRMRGALPAGGDPQQTIWLPAFCVQVPKPPVAMNGTAPLFSSGTIGFTVSNTKGPMNCLPVTWNSRFAPQQSSEPEICSAQLCRVPTVTILYNL